MPLRYFGILEDDCKQKWRKRSGKSVFDERDIL